jgi:hypothetical protein
MLRPSVCKLPFFLAVCVLALSGKVNILRAQENDCFKCSAPAQARAHRAIRRQRTRQIATRIANPGANVQQGNLYSSPQLSYGDPLSLNYDFYNSTASPGLDKSFGPATPLQLPDSSSYLGGLPTSRSGNGVGLIGTNSFDSWLTRRQLEQPNREQEELNKRIEQYKLTHPPPAKSVLHPGTRSGGGSPISSGRQPLNQSNLPQLLQQFRQTHPNFESPAPRPTNGISGLGNRQRSSRPGNVP